MDNGIERRREQRLRYHWPVWFAEDFNENLSQGQMVDVSSGGAAFTYYANQCHTWPGQQITAKFSVPQFGEEDSFELASFTRVGNVCRVEQINDFTRRVAVQFAEPLSFKPAEQITVENEEELKTLAV